jgi:uncharacterized protein YuzE
MRMTITSTPNPPTVELRLSSSQVASEASGDVVADLNQNGNWIRGLELLGSSERFSLERALAPYSPAPSAAAAAVRPPQSELKVTYDRSADAGYLYLPYRNPEGVSQAVQDDPLLLKCSYCVEDESALFGLGEDGALVFIRFKVPPNEKLDSFMKFFGG